MATGYRETREQKDYERMFEKHRELLSDAGYYVLQQARSAAYAAFMTRPAYRFQPQEYYEATQKMRRVTDELTERDRVRLSKIARAALAAAASIDPDDEDSTLWERWHLGKLYWMYRTVSNMLGDILREGAAKEWLKATGRVEDVPADLSSKTHRPEKNGEGNSRTSSKETSREEQSK